MVLNTWGKIDLKERGKDFIPDSVEMVLVSVPENRVDVPVSFLYGGAKRFFPVELRLLHVNGYNEYMVSNR